MRYKSECAAVHRSLPIIVGLIGLACAADLCAKEPFEPLPSGPGALPYSTDKQAPNTDSEKQAARNNVVEVEPGVTQIVRISRSLPTRLVTPYSNPELITQAETDTWTVGSVIYVLPKNPDRAVAGFIQSQDGQHAFPIVMEVADIPPQEILFEDPGYAPIATGESRRPLTRSTTGGLAAHVELTIELARQAIERDGDGSFLPIPGFKQIRVRRPQIIYAGPIRLELEQAQENGAMRVERLLATHEGTNRREIHEGNFADDTTLGVLLFPPVSSMAPGDTANVWRIQRVAR